MEERKKGEAFSVAFSRTPGKIPKIFLKVVKVIIEINVEKLISFSQTMTTLKVCYCVIDCKKGEENF